MREPNKTGSGIDARLQALEWAAKTAMTGNPDLIVQAAAKFEAFILDGTVGEPETPKEAAE